MTDLTKLAKGQECTVQLDGICSHDPEQTVLAHLRMAGITGMGQKAPHLLGAWACNDCHAEVDRRTQKLEREHVEYEFLKGVMRTQYKLIRMGKVKW